MAKRIIVHLITDCDGCDVSNTQLADAELPDPQGRVRIRPQEAPAADNGFAEIKINGAKRHLCPKCQDGLKGVFKAGRNIPLQEEPVLAEPKAVARIMGQG